MRSDAKFDCGDESLSQTTPETRAEYVQKVGKDPKVLGGVWVFNLTAPLPKGYEGTASEPDTRTDEAAPAAAHLVLQTVFMTGTNGVTRVVATSRVSESAYGSYVPVTGLTQPQRSTVESVIEALGPKRCNLPVPTTQDLLNLAVPEAVKAKGFAGLAELGKE